MSFSFSSSLETSRYPVDSTKPDRAVSRGRLGIGRVDAA
jgi:hypothetical protein